MSTIDCSGAIIFSRITHRILLLQKREGKHAGKFVIPGGTNLGHESSYDCLLRELTEEIGSISFVKTIPLERFVSNDNLFNFQTYFCIVENEFIPILSNEHIAWGWFSIDNLPKPIHRGFNLSIRNKIIQSKIQTIIEIIDLL